MTLRAKQMTTPEAYITMFDDLMMQRRTALPGFITAINTKSGALVSVDVQPAISHMVTNADGINVDEQVLPIVPGVPVVTPRSQVKGLSLTVPISVGDEALLVFADRSLDTWQTTGKVSKPYEPIVPRTHEITDAIAVVGISNDKTPISNYSFDSVQMRNKTSTVSVSVSGNAIKIDNNGVKITVDGNSISMENGASSIIIESSKITISSPSVEIKGEDFEMDSTNNTVTGGGLTNDSGLDFDNHVHSDPQGGVTGPPVNP